MTVVLNDVGYPQTEKLKTRLNEKGINYTIRDTSNEFKINSNFVALPVIEVDGKQLNYTQAMKWLDEN